MTSSTNSTDTQGFLENLTRDVVGENGLTVFDLAELRDAIDRRTKAIQTEARKSELENINKILANGWRAERVHEIVKDRLAELKGQK